MSTDPLLLRFLAMSAIVGALLSLGCALDILAQWFWSGRARAFKRRCIVRYQRWTDRRAEQRLRRRMRRDVLGVPRDCDRKINTGSWT